MKRITQISPVLGRW